jgi:DNA-binding response OmpR family regulator
VCRRIKAEAANKTTIVAISGKPDWEKKAIQAGADAFMSKPLDLQMLHETTNRLLRIL